MEELFRGFLTEGQASWAGHILEAVLVLAVGYFAVKLVLRLLRRILERTKLERALTAFLLSVIRIVLLVLLVLTALDCLRINMTPILTALGSVGLALSLALQDSLKNLAGGVHLLFTRPFGLEDYVEIGDQAGTVKEIGLVNTRLTTPDGKRIYVPNGDVAKSVIVNYSAEPRRRLDLTFSIAYENDVVKAQELIRQALDSHEKVLKEPEALVRIAALGSSSVELTCYAWVKTEDYWPVTFDLREQIKTLFEQERITIPYPQIDVHMK